MTVYVVTPHAGRGRPMRNVRVEAERQADAAAHAAARLKAAGTPYAYLTVRAEGAA